MGQREDRVTTVVNSNPEWVTHGKYKGWWIYRARLNGRNCMCYGAYDPDQRASVYGINLQDIKDIVSEVVNTHVMPGGYDTGIGGGLTERCNRIVDGTAREEQ